MEDEDSQAPLRGHVPAPRKCWAAWEQRALHRAVGHTRFCGAQAMLRVPLRELSAQPGHGTEPRVSRSVLTSLSEARLNSTKMCATTSHAKQLGMLTLSRSLMKPRSALLNCQGDRVVMVCPASSQREATFAWGQPSQPVERQRVHRRSLRCQGSGLGFVQHNNLPALGAFSAPLVSLFLPK